ncbi:MAG: hypothetical protein IJ588_05760 [Prevotella sp.]|nr:hypothetical protein [Prevotella sp.]
MKKRLLLQMLAVFFAVCGYAQTQYFYSHTAKYMVLGENLLTNGDFSNGLAGWQDAEGNAASADAWSIEAGSAAKGGNALMSLSAPNSLYLAQKVETGGLYAVSLYVKAETTNVNTTITEGGQNRIDVFVNTTGEYAKGEGAVQVASTESFSDEWTQLVFAAHMEDNQYIIIAAQNVATGIMISDIAINTVKEVYDTRKGERLVTYLESLLKEESLPNGRDALQGALEDWLKPALQDVSQTDDKDAMESTLGSLDDVVTEFLDANGANLFPAYLQDWTSWGQYNYSKLGTKDNWTFEGGRWGFTGNTNYLEFAEGDGYIASAGIQNTGQYTLDVSVRTRDDKLNDLPAGKYFFQIEAQAVAAANRANPYGSNYSIEIANPYFFFGTDTVKIEDVMSGYDFKTYYAIGEIKEGEKKVFGFHFPIVDGKVGGRFSVRNPKAYLLGTSTDEQAYKKLVNDFIVQQVNLNKRITEYPVELNATDYPWEQDSLARAIADAQPVYNASLLIIDAEGNVLDKDQLTEEKIQELLDQVNALGRARTFVINQNAPIATLKEAVAAGNAALNDPAYAGAAAGKRTALQGAVAAGQALLDGISATNQGEAFTEAANAILTAKEEYESTSASRTNPTEILIKNADFSDFSAGNNITSFTAPTKDWNWSVSASANRWEIRDNETLSQGHGASIWRGTTVQLDAKAQQTVELTYEGLYEYRAEAYISEERIAELVAAATVIYSDDENNSVAVDTLFTPNIRLFFGENGAPDSVTISKWYNGVKNDGTYFTREVSGAKYGGMVYALYSVYFKKSGSAPLSAEFGLEAADNYAAAGANGFGFGNNKIFYVGDETQYLTDTKADVEKAVADAKTLVAGVDNYWAVKVNRYIGDAEKATTAKQMQNALWGLQETTSRLSAVITGVKGVFADEPAVRQELKGVYTIQGVKVADDADSLKPGLYIINGKKVFRK